MSSDAKQFVLGLIEKKARLPVGVDVPAFNYIDSGYVDSIEIIKFVVDIEAAFNVEISDADLESPEFRTVGGLISMIGGKIAAGRQSC